MMKTKTQKILRLITLVVTLGFSSLLYSQQLVINEVSQGPSGTKEYVELLVVGQPTCTTIPTMDLRDYVVDDNNGTFASGSGTGIATGCVRFKNVTFWSSIPVGTIILIYNDGDPNVLVPATDLSMTDGNCRLIIPISDCTLLERHTSQPSTSTSTFPTTGYTNCGNWGPLGMSNSDDSFQTISPTGTLLHAVSWGNNINSTVIYFSGGASAKVAVMTNAVDNNPANQANWSMLAVSGNETPGSPNNTANANWIHSMNNSCTPITPLTLVVNGTNAGCSCTGSATVTPSGGIAPYTYTWSPAGGNAASASGLCAGVYTVSVSSSNGCLTTETVSIGSTSTLTMTTQATNVSCNGLSNGSATVTPSNGTGPYAYAWLPSGGNASSASGLSAGVYSVTVTDANSCVKTGTVSITQPAAIALSMSSTSVACHGGTTGSATITAMGGTGPFSYTWSPGTSNNASIMSLSTGTYSVSVLDANQCAGQSTVSIAEPPAATLSIVSSSVTCFNGNNGSAALSVSGGTAPYLYAWSPSGGTGSTALNLVAGSYTVSVTDNNNCIYTASVNLAQPPALSLSISSTSVSCFNGTNGSASVNVSGGTAPYTYTWSPSGGNATTASTLGAGVYTVSVTDNNFCQASASVSVIQPIALASTTAVTNVSCNGLADGSATITVSGGVAPYAYSWAPLGGTTNVATGLAAGSYTATVTDDNACTYTTVATIAQPTALALSVSSSSVLCFGGSSGSATVTATGATAPYTYTWTSGSSTAVSTALQVGTYTVNINDAHLCAGTATVSITGPTDITLSNATSPSLCNLANGSATVTATGGTGVYTYAWLPSGGTGAAASGLLPGTYTTTVTDGNGCSKTITSTITTPGTVTTSISSSSVSCNGGTNGSISVTATGGTGPYTYAWLPAGTASSNTVTTVNTASAGNYTITVSDVNNCTSTQTVSIVQPSPVTISVMGMQVCEGQQATVTATVSGGTAPYTYQWSPGGSSSASLVVSPSATTNYTLQASDSHNCQGSPSVITITVLPSLTVAVTGPTLACSGTSVALTAQATGGNGNYQYMWQPGNLSGAVINPVITADVQYTVTLTDGCSTTSAQAQHAVSVLPAPTVDIHTTTKQGCQPVCVQFFDSTLVNSGQIASWLWKFSDGSTSAASSPQVCFTQSGNYTGTLTVQTNNGCVVTPATVSGIQVYPQPVADFTSEGGFEKTVSESVFELTNTSTNTDNVIWHIDTYTYTSNSVNYTAGDEGHYPVVLIASNQYGCVDSVRKDLIVMPDFTFFAPNAFTPNDDDRNNIFMPVGRGWKNDSYVLTIFDRWGNLVYKTSDVNKGWDGRPGGVPVQQDVYVWKVDLTDIFNKPHSYVGSVTVVR